MIPLFVFTLFFLVRPRSSLVRVLNPFPTGQDLNDITRGFYCPSTDAWIAIGVGEENAVVKLIKSSDTAVALPGAAYVGSEGSCLAQSLDWASVDVDPSTGSLVAVVSEGDVMGVSKDCGVTWRLTCISPQMAKGTMVSFTNNRWFVGGYVNGNKQTALLVSETSDPLGTWKVANVDLKDAASFDGFHQMAYLSDPDLYVATAGFGYTPFPEQNSSNAFMISSPSNPYDWKLHMVGDFAMAGGCPPNGVDALAVDEARKVLIMATGSCCNPQGYIVNFDSLLSDWRCTVGLNRNAISFTQIFHSTNETWIALGTRSSFASSGPTASKSIDNGGTWIPQTLRASDVRHYQLWEEDKDEGYAVGFSGAVASGSLSEFSFVKDLTSGFTTQDVVGVEVMNGMNVLVTITVDRNHYRAGTQLFVQQNGEFKSLDSQNYLPQKTLVRKSDWSLISRVTDHDFENQAIVRALPTQGRNFEKILSLQSIPNGDFIQGIALASDGSLIVSLGYKNATCAAIIMEPTLQHHIEVPLHYDYECSTYQLGPVLSPDGKTAAFSNGYQTGFLDLKSQQWQLTSNKSIGLHAYYASEVFVPWMDSYLALSGSTSPSAVVYKTSGPVLADWDPVVTLEDTQGRNARAIRLNEETGEVVIVGNLGLCMRTTPDLKGKFEICPAAGLPQQNYLSIAFNGGKGGLIGGSRGLVIDVLDG